MSKPLKKAQIFESGKIIVHFTGVFQSDYALCGQDLAGDSAGFDGEGAYESEPTNNKVDCEDCLRIVYHCKKLKP